MKKLVVVCLALVMAVSMGLTSFAAGAFVSSPSGNSAPTLLEGTPHAAGCTAKLKVTACSDRDTLSDEERLLLEEAYEQISAPSAEFTKALEQLAEENNMSVSQLSASDLFNIGYSDCETHDGHTGYTIKLQAETFANFVGLMYFNGTTWEIVGVSEWNEEDLTITFDVEHLGAFAVIVDNGSGSDVPDTDAPDTDAPDTDAPETDAPETEAPETDIPDTGDNAPNEDENKSPQTGSNSAVYLCAMIASGVALAVVSLKKRKA